MRTDEELARSSFRFSREWQRREDGAPLTPEIDRRLQGGFHEDGRYLVHSLSGHESNHLFMNEKKGTAFADRSLISGLDSSADGRGFALMDFNRDGKHDIALVNANTPAFNLYRNAMSAAETGNFIAIRFVGGNRGRAAVEGLACRDGYGAKVAIHAGELKITREHRCGEGYASQNSATMLVGVGNAESVDRLTVTWPSGKTDTLEGVAVGTLITADEARKETFEMKTYGEAFAPEAPEAEPRRAFPLAEQDIHASKEARLRLYTTTATWCAACIDHLPEVNALIETTAPLGVEVVAVPIDLEDDAAKLEAYAEQWTPAYRLLSDLPADARTEVARFLGEQLRVEEPPLPSTVITDGMGRVVSAKEGFPSLSDIRRLLGDAAGSPEESINAEASQ